MLRIDDHEPQAVYHLLKQCTEVEWAPLNRSGWADYWWQGCDNRVWQVERKQWPELLSDVDAVEDQLRKEMQLADETCLLIEGVVSGSAEGVQTFKKSLDKPYYRLNHTFGAGSRASTLMQRIYGWLFDLDRSGVTVIQTTSGSDTAVALLAWYNHSQRAELTTLQRYIKPRITPKVQSPLVITLMGIQGAGIGQVRAEKIAERYESVLMLSWTSVRELASIDGLGVRTATTILRALGRQDV